MAQKVFAKWLNSSEHLQVLKSDNQAEEIPLLSARASSSPGFQQSLETFENLKCLIKGSGSRKDFIQGLQAFDNVDFTDPRDGQTLLHCAAKEGKSEMLQILLEAGVNHSAKDLKESTPLHLVVGKGCGCKSCSADRVECIQSLINAGSLPDPVDSKGFTPLYYAVKNKYSDSSKTLLDFGANLNFELKANTRSILTILAERLPEVLLYELDKCITYDPEDSLKLVVDFRLLLQVPEGKVNHDIQPRETELLQSVLKIKAGYDKIVTHPVVETFLHFKWKVVRRMFFLWRSFYFLLLLLYTFVMFRIYSNHCINDDYFDGEKCSLTEYDRIAAYILYFFVGLIAAAEVYKVFTSYSTYFSDGNIGYLWWILCIFWTSCLVPAAFGPPPLYYHFPIAATSVIYSWLMLLSQLNRIPWFAIHVGLLMKVVKNFFRLLATFCTVLLAFALGFCILLPDNVHFNSIPFALFKTFMIMKGDIDYEGILDKRTNQFLNIPNYSIAAHALYTIFVIVVTMVLTAVVIGLAVKDIDETLKQAAVNRSLRLIREIGFFESILQNRMLTCGMMRCLSRAFSIEKTKEIKDHKLTFSPMEPDSNSLPIDLNNAFLKYYDNCCCQKRKTRRLTRK